VALAYNPVYSGGRDQEDCHSQLAQIVGDPVSKNPITKRTQVWSGSRCRPWIQTPASQKKKKEHHSMWLKNITNNKGTQDWKKKVCNESEDGRLVPSTNHLASLGDKTGGMVCSTSGPPIFLTLTPTQNHLQPLNPPWSTPSFPPTGSCWRSLPHSHWAFLVYDQTFVGTRDKFQLVKS
jgi:hypothetical protein